MDDEIDVDGEDEVLFGAPQFTEQDVLAPPELIEAEAQMEVEEDVEVDVDDGIGTSEETSGGAPHRDPKKRKTLRDLVVEGKVVRQQVENAKRTMDEVTRVKDTEEIDLDIELARRGGDQAALIRALESKVQLLVSKFYQPVSSLDDSVLVSGIHEGVVFNVAPLSHLFGPLH